MLFGHLEVALYVTTSSLRFESERTELVAVQNQKQMMEKAKTA